MSSSNRMGRNPFAKPAAATARHHTTASSQHGILPKVAIELPIHLVFLGLKSLVFVREMFRTVVHG